MSDNTPYPIGNIITVGPMDSHGYFYTKNGLLFCSPCGDVYINIQFNEEIIHVSEIKVNPGPNGSGSIPLSDNFKKYAPMLGLDTHDGYFVVHNDSRTIELLDITEEELEFFREMYCG